MPLFKKPIEQEFFSLRLRAGRPMTELEFYARELTDWETSPERREMIDGDRYYTGDHDILKRQRTAIGPDGKLITIENLPNNRIVDNQYAKHVDQKANYLLGQPISFSCENDDYAAEVKKVLGMRFMRTLKSAGVECLNAGISWLYPYYNKNGELAFRVFPGYEIMPFWADAAHTELDSALRLYPVEVYYGTEKKIVKKVDLFTLEGVTTYIFENGVLTPDTEKQAYVKVKDSKGNEQPLNWERFPLIPIKYNPKEAPLIRRGRSLQDAINLLQSDFVNNMEEFNMETNILIESGTNELEVLEFTIGNNHYGINVAKVREIVPYEKITPVPNAHEYVEGIFMPRDTMISVVNLAKVTGNYNCCHSDSDMLIITNFNKLHIGFHVEQVAGIHRVSWERIIVPDATINSVDHGITTGVIKMDDRIIIILDFEKIISDISPETGLKVKEIEALGERERNDYPIYIAEDSALLAQLIHDSLYKAGYVNIDISNNGQACYDKLVALKNQYGDKITDHVKCVITDIEMPLMDGHRLTKLIKSDDILKNIPVAIFSSLITEEMERKGRELGADIQMSKPEIGQLVSELDKLFSK